MISINVEIIQQFNTAVVVTSRYWCPTAMNISDKLEQVIPIVTSHLSATVAQPIDIVPDEEAEHFEEKKLLAM